MKKNILLLCILSSLLYSMEFYYQSNQKIYLTQSSTNLRSYDSTTYYVTEENVTLGVKDEIMIELDNSLITIDQLIALYDISLLKQIGERFYLCQVEEPSMLFEIAAQIHEEKGVLASHPNFIKAKSLR